MWSKALLINTNQSFGPLMLFGLLIMLTACHINSDISEPKDPGGFTFQREDTFSCGGTTNTVKIYKHEITGLEFVLLPGNEEIDPFLISRTETTQGVWLSIMGTYEWRFGGGVHAYVQEGEDNPAVFITYGDAVSFCKKTNLRLPTESEWMYACRAGSNAKYFFGDSIDDLDDYAWHCGNAESAREAYAHRVGLKRPNAFGLYDIYGNVSEWCGSMPRQGQQISASNKYVLCGGSYSLFDPNPSGECVDWSSTEIRTEKSAYDGSTWFGFRPACSLLSIKDN